MPKAKKTKNLIEKQFVFNSDNIQEIIEKQSQGFSLPRYMNPWFMNQQGVRRKGVVYGWTEEELQEFTKCAFDIHYFANTYCKIKSEDGQVRQMKLRKYQYKVLDAYTKNRFTLNMSSRQTGKTICAAIVLLHYAIFNTNKGIMIVANKAETVVEIVDKIKNIYKLLPFFIKPGIVNWNTRTVVFDNGCRIKSQARSKEPAIGFTIDFLYLDEFAHIPKNIINHYYKAVVPTVSSIKGSKIVITSTPNGANLFKDLVMGASLPDGHPDKNMYDLIKVYWYQVPDGKFDDGTTGTRFDPKIYPNTHDLKTHHQTIDTIEQSLRQAGYKTVQEIEITEKGDKSFIRVLHEPGKVEIDQVREFKVDNVDLLKLATITNWKEQETKLIGGEESFNQEYGLQFIAGSKRVLSASTAKKLEARTTKYEHREIEVLDKRLRVDYSELRWAPDFIEADRNKYYWVTALDISEGLGQDDSVLNMFRLMVRSDEWLKENKIKTLSDAFYLKQTGIYNFNKINHKTDLPELFYLLHFDYLDSNRVRSIVEYNGPGGTFLSMLPHVFDQKNNFGNFVFVRFYHSQKDKVKKIGLKVTRNKKELVKAYIDAVETDKLYVDEQKTLEQMDNFIKVETRSGDYTYKADAGHDDIVMTEVHASTFFDSQEYKNLCYTYFSELESSTQTLIDAAMDLDYNPDAISYKNLNNILSRNKGKLKKSDKYTGGTGRFMRK